MVKGRDVGGWLLGFLVLFGAISCAWIAIKSPPKTWKAPIVR